MIRIHKMWCPHLKFFSWPTKLIFWLRHGWGDTATDFYDCNIWCSRPPLRLKHLICRLFPLIFLLVLLTDSESMKRAKYSKRRLASFLFKINSTSRILMCMICVADQSGEGLCLLMKPPPPQWTKYCQLKATTTTPYPHHLLLTGILLILCIILQIIFFPSLFTFSSDTITQNLSSFNW